MMALKYCPNCKQKVKAGRPLTALNFLIGFIGFFVAVYVGITFVQIASGFGFPPGIHMLVIGIIGFGLVEGIAVLLSNAITKEQCPICKATNLQADQS